MTVAPPTASPEPRGQSWYRRIALFGVVLVWIFALILGTAFLIGGEYEGLIFVSIVSVVALVVGFILVRFGKWAPIAGVVGGAFALFSSAPFILYSPEVFDSFFDFVPALVSLVASLALIVGSVLAFLDERSEPLTTESPAWRTGILGVSGVLAAVGVVSLILTLTGVESVSDEERAEADTVVEMSQTEFEPDVIEVSAGDIAIVVENEDPITHTFTIDELDVDEDFGAGDDKFVEFSAEPGEYELKCDVPGHEDMDAIIRVQ